MNNVQLLTNAQIRAINPRAGRARVTDLRTMQSYDIFWGGPPQAHTDFSPLTPQDTEIMRRISGGWNWNARPVVLHIGNLNLAAGVHHFPHGSIIGGNPGLPSASNVGPFIRPNGGHMCMWFKDSRPNSGDSNSQYARSMRGAAAEAFRIVQEMEDEMRFRTVADMPDWARKPIQRLVDTGILRGTGKTHNGQPILDMPETMMRTLIVTRNMILNKDKL